MRAAGIEGDHSGHRSCSHGVFGQEEELAEETGSSPRGYDASVAPAEECAQVGHGQVYMRSPGGRAGQAGHGRFRHENSMYGHRRLEVCSVVRVLHEAGGDPLCEWGQGSSVLGGQGPCQKGLCAGEEAWTSMGTAGNHLNTCF